MNLADTVILAVVALIVGSVILSGVKKRNAARRNRKVEQKCSGCAYKGFCGKSPGK